MKTTLQNPTGQTVIAPLEQTAHEPEAQKKPWTHGKVKARWISILMVVGLIGVFLLTSVSIGTSTQTSHAVPLAPKLVVLHHQFYNRPMEGCIDIGYPTPLPGRDPTYSFPDPLQRGMVTYHTTITNITQQGITFLVEVKFVGKTYQFTISGVKPDEGIQIQLSNKQNTAYIATLDEVQFAVAGAERSMGTGEVVVSIHFTYQKMWHWKDATEEL
jgi:hypothetical protein